MFRCFSKKLWTNFDQFFFFPVPFLLALLAAGAPAVSAQDGAGQPAVGPERDPQRRADRLGAVAVAEAGGADDDADGRTAAALLPEGDPARPR